MRGFGDFQRSQMKQNDPRVTELFHHIRAIVDVVEQLMLRPQEQMQPSPERAAPITTPTSTPAGKLTYSVQEVSSLFGVSRYMIYNAVQTKNLPTVRFGRRILIPVHALHAWLQAAP